MPIPHGTISGYRHHKCRCDECKVAARADDRCRREANPERYRDYRKRSYEANREKIAEYNRRRQADPRHRRLKCDAQQRREARQRGAFVEDVPRSEIFERDNWQCQIPGCLYPGIPVKLEGRRTDPLYANVDHIIPLSKGGRHERSNLATAHFRCNVVKNDHIEGIAS
jgi:5-methylcytosine-specific restriction endonuclease McrA